MKIAAGLILKGVSTQPLISETIEIDDKVYEKAKDKADLIQRHFIDSIGESLVVEYEILENQTKET